MLLKPEHRKYLPILISSSVSASPIHSNWKSCKDCENFCTAMDKSRIQEKGEKKKSELLQYFTGVRFHAFLHENIFSVYSVSFLVPFFGYNLIQKSLPPFQNGNAQNIPETYETH